MKLKPIYFVIIILVLFVYGLFITDVFQGYSEPDIPNYPAFLKLQENMIDAEEEQLSLIDQNLQLKGNIEFYQEEMVGLIEQINKRPNLDDLLTETLNGGFNSPQDRIDDGQVQVMNNRVVLNVNNVNKWYVLDTNSMVPIMDEGATLLTTEPISDEGIGIGDIIFFNSHSSETTIVHRVIDISSDSGGKYFITKGDSNPNEDAIKVRYSDIVGILIGIIY